MKSLIRGLLACVKALCFMSALLAMFWAVAILTVLLTGCTTPEPRHACFGNTHQFEGDLCR